ncbi:unnamed protein product [Lepidochelys kempii]
MGYRKKERNDGFHHLAGGYVRPHSHPAEPVATMRLLLWDCVAMKFLDQNSKSPESKQYSMPWPGGQLRVLSSMALSNHNCPVGSTLIRVWPAPFAGKQAFQLREQSNLPGLDLAHINPEDRAGGNKAGSYISGAKYGLYNS